MPDTDGKTRWPVLGLARALSDPWDRAFFLLLALAVFLLPFHQLTGVKNTIIFATLAFLLTRTWQERRHIPGLLRASPPLLWMTLYAVVAFTSALFADDPIESLRAFRSDLLKQLILGAGVLYFARRTGHGLFWLHLVLSSMAARSLYVAGEFLYHQQIILAGNPLYLEIHTVSHGYALDVSTLFPLLVGVTTLLWKELSTLLRTLYIATGLFASWALLHNVSTTPMVMIAASFILLVPLLPNPRTRRILGGLLLAIVILPLLYQPVRDRILTHHWNRLTSASTWTGERAFNNRRPIWAGYMELIREKPWLGHGVGFRQSAALFPRLAADNPVIADMIRLSPCSDKALLTGALCDRQPHNTYLGFLFQSGIPGLVTWLGFLFSLMWGLARRRDPPSRAMLLLWLLFIPGAVINGLWNAVIGKMLMVAAMAGVDHLTRKEARHDPT